MSNSSTSNSKRSYTRRGIASKRVDVGFMPEELARGRELAAEASISHSAHVRQVYLIGLPHYEKLRKEAAEAARALKQP